MRYLLLLATVSAGFLLAGCREDGKGVPADEAVKSAQSGKLYSCTGCRKTVENAQIRRVNQTHGHCPFCKKIRLMVPVR